MASWLICCGFFFVLLLLFSNGKNPFCIFYKQMGLQQEWGHQHYPSTGVCTVPR